MEKLSQLVNSPFTSLIVGFGSTGQDAFKFLYEYSAFVGPDLKKSPFKCYAIDEKINKIAGLIRKKMPAIGEDELTLVQATVDSEEFWENTLLERIQGNNIDDTIEYRSALMEYVRVSCDNMSTLNSKKYMVALPMMLLLSVYTQTSMVYHNMLKN